MARANKRGIFPLCLLLASYLSGCGAASNVVAPPAVPANAAASPPARPAAAAAQPSGASQSEADCRTTCNAQLASSREEIATQLGERFEACPSEADNDRADCLEGANAQLASANAEVEAAFAACNDACAQLRP